jgi:hypothetical protein
MPRQPKASDRLLTLNQARQRLGLGQVSELLHLVLEHQILPTRRRGYSFWYLSPAQLVQLERLVRRTRAGSTRPS